MRRLNKVLSVMLILSLASPFSLPSFSARAEGNPADSQSPDADLLNNCDPYPYQLEQSGPVDAQKNPEGIRHDARLETNPNAPLLLKPKTAVKSYGCHRFFLYRGRLSTADSYNQQDGEHLRPILSSDSQSLSELDLYQSNRRKVRIGAYAGTAAVLIALGSVIMANQFGGATRTRIRTYGLIGGLGIAIGVGIFSLAILRTNESHLQKAVDHYNSGHPDDKVVLQFSTGLLF
jgi:hypothetical protein